MCSTLEPLYCSSYATTVGGIRFIDFIDSGYLLAHESGVHEVFLVSMFQKYTLDPTHVVDWGKLIIDTDGTFEEGLMRIMDSRDQVQRKTMRLVKVLW